MYTVQQNVCVKNNSPVNSSPALPGCEDNLELLWTLEEVLVLHPEFWFGWSWWECYVEMMRQIRNDKV